MALDHNTLSKCMQRRPFTRYVLELANRLSDNDLCEGLCLFLVLYICSNLISRCDAFAANPRFCCHELFDYEGENVNVSPSILTKRLLKLTKYHEGKKQAKTTSRPKPTAEVELELALSWLDCFHLSVHQRGGKCNKKHWELILSNVLFVPPSLTFTKKRTKQIIQACKYIREDIMREVAKTNPNECKQSKKRASYHRTRYVTLLVTSTLKRVYNRFLFADLLDINQYFTDDNCFPSFIMRQLGLIGDPIPLTTSTERLYLSDKNKQYFDIKQNSDIVISADDVLLFKIRLVESFYTIIPPLQQRVINCNRHCTIRLMFSVRPCLKSHNLSYHFFMFIK